MEKNCIIERFDFFVVVVKGVKVRLKKKKLRGEFFLFKLSSFFFNCFVRGGSTRCNIYKWLRKNISQNVVT